MFGINKRMKAVHGDEPGEPRKNADKATLAQDQAALAIVVSAAAIILVAVVSIVLARNVENLTKQTTTLLERLTDTQGAVKSLADDLALVKGSMTVGRGEDNAERKAEASGPSQISASVAETVSEPAGPLAQAERLLLELRRDEAEPAQAEKLDRVLELLRAASHG